MELTPEQKEQVRQAKAAGERRVTLRFTPEQREEWQAAVQQELAGKEENLAHFRKLKAAAERPGFFGDVRRAMACSRRPDGRVGRRNRRRAAAPVRLSAPATRNCRRQPWTG